MWFMRLILQCLYLRLMHSRVLSPSLMGSTKLFLNPINVAVAETSFVRSVLISEANGLGSGFTG